MPYNQTKLAIHKIGLNSLLLTKYWSNSITIVLTMKSLASD